MMRLFAVLLLLLPAFTADAATIRYYEDPVYKPLAAEDPHPMEDLVNLAEQGNARAQYILGDLYGKGKGGLGKNRVKARYWFETSARGGYTMAFIRLAAMAKREKDYIAAYKWYSLSADNGVGRERKWAQKSRELLAKDKKLSRDDIREAREAVNNWVRERETARAEDRERAKEAREQAQEDGDTETETEKITGKSATQEQKKFKYIKKEHDFNE